MSIPDEIFVNPRSPTDIEFGSSIVATLTGSSGDVTGSYIKTDRLGEMTHYMSDNNLVSYPLKDYKCFASRFIQTGRNIDRIPSISVDNSDDSFAKDFNNLESYGNHLISASTLSEIPTVNPPSVALPSFTDYCELQMDFPESHPTYLELMIKITGASNYVFQFVRRHDSSPWVVISPPETKIDDQEIPNEPSGIWRLGFDLTETPPELATNLRFRIMNANATGGSMNIKLYNIFLAGDLQS